ncbi:MAG: spore coat associated protein CotJA [Lachnospiraceae bacterium]|nr:spore coat associated protein CotJA [Lachnospiraceae bacterium]
MQDYNFDERFEHYPIAMAYVPWQHLSQIYENLEEAFQIGTIFPELDKPFTGRRVIS